MRKSRPHNGQRLRRTQTPPLCAGTVSAVVVVVVQHRGRWRVRLDNRRRRFSSCSLRMTESGSAKRSGTVPASVQGRRRRRRVVLVGGAHCRPRRRSEQPHRSPASWPPRRRLACRCHQRHHRHPVSGHRRHRGAGRASLLASRRRRIGSAAYTARCHRRPSLHRHMDPRRHEEARPLDRPPR